MTDAASQPLHIRIRDQFRQRILSGDLNPGDRLPPESQIMAQFDVSRGTVNRALRDLEQQGVLQRRRGAGTFVRRMNQQESRANQQIAMFIPWAMQGESFGFIQGHIHQMLAGVCSRHDILLSLQFLSAQGLSLREQMLGAARSLLARNLRLILYCPSELPSEQMHWNREVVDLLVKNGAKIILIDRDLATHPDRSEFTWISYDNTRGAALLVQHMFQQGYRRIAFIGSRSDSTAVSQRLGGYMEGLHACGLPIDQALMIAPETPGCVDDAICRKMMSERPDAVICKDFELALQVYKWLAANGLRVGPDLGVAGFDDAPITAQLPVPMTVIRQPVEPFVAATFRVLQSHMNESEETCRGEQIVIRTELVARASTVRE